MQVLKVNHLCTVSVTDTSRISASLCTSAKICHHTLLHSEAQNKASSRSQDRATAQADTLVGSHAATRWKSDVLLMTSHVLITVPEARALLDNASSASFISNDWYTVSLYLAQINQSVYLG